MRQEPAPAEGREASELRDLLEAVRSLHERSLAEASDGRGGTDWIEYLILMLLGGGGLYTERRRTSKERDRLHERIDELRATLATLREGRE